MASEDKPTSTAHKEHLGDVDVVQTVHQDGTVDYVDTHAIGGDLDGMPPGYFMSIQFIGTVTAVCCASICAYLGWVLPANTLLLINADIGPDPNINWVATVWTLGTAVGFLLVGRLSDIFGRKWMVMGTTGLGLIGCIIGCTAKNVSMLIGANVCNGLAAAGQLSFGIVLGELVPNKQRGPIVTLVFFSSMPFAVFGPIIARSFIQNTEQGWRWSYYLGIILSVVALVLYQFLYHPPTYGQLHVEGKTKRQQMAELDYVGIFLFTSGMVLFLIGLSWGGTTYPWASAHVLCTLLIGIATLVFLGFYESYLVKHTPLLPPRLFKNSGFVAIVLCATIGSMIYYSMTILWPTIISTVYTTDSLKVGWQSSVVGGGVLLGQCIGGFALSYIPKVKYQTIFAACCVFAFVTALSSISESAHATFIILGMFGTVSVGFVENITFPGVTLVIEPQDIGLATGVLGSIRACGGSIAQALYVSVLTNKIATYLPEYVVPAATEAGLPESSIPALFAGITAGNFTAVEGISPQIIGVVGEAVKQAYISSFKIVFYTTIPFSALLVVGACFVPNMERFLGNNVAKKLQGFGKGVVPANGSENGSEGVEKVEVVQEKKEVEVV